MADEMNLQIILESINNSSAGFTEMDGALNKIKGLADEMARSFTSFSTAIENMMASASQSVSSLESPLQSVVTDINNLDEPLKNVGQTADEAAKALDGVTKAAGDVGKQADSVNGIDDPIKNISSLADDASKSIQGIVDSAKLIGTDDAYVQQLAGSLDKIVQSATDARDALQGVAAEEEAVGKSAPRNNGASSNSASKKNEGLFSIQGQMDTMYAGMSLGMAAAPIDAGIGASIKTFADFDQAVANVNSMMGDTPEQINAIKQQLIDLSKTVPDGPVALANALYGIVGAGVPAADAMSVLQTASKAAAAGQTDVGTATNALIAVMDSYGLDASNVTQIADQMFAANAAGAMTFDSFAKSVGTVAGPAAQVGISFDQVAAATAALTNEGLSAQRSTMGLRALLMGIAAPTAGATKEAKALGIEWDNNALQSKGLVGMMQEAMNATGGNAQELKKLIPNIAAWTVATDLGGKGAQSFAQAMDTMGQSAGATDRAMTAQNAGFTEQMDHMKASIQSAQIEFVSGIIPALEQFVGWIKQLADWFQSLSPGMREFLVLGALFSGVILTMGAGFMMMISNIGGAISGFKALREALTATKIAEEGLAAAEAATDALNPFMWIPLVIIGLIALTAAIIAWWGPIKSFFQKAWDEMRSVTTVAWDGIKDYFIQWGPEILSVLTMGILPLVMLIVSHWDQIKAYTEQVWNGLITGIENLWSGFKTWISTEALAALKFIVDAFNWMYNHNYYFKDLVDFIRTQWQQIEQDATTIWTAVETFFSALWNRISTTATNTWTAIRTALTTLWNGFVTILKTIWNPISTFFSGLWTGISNDASAIWGTIQSTMDGQWNGIVGDAENIFNGLGTFFTDLWTQAEQWGANIVHMIAQGIQNAAHEVEQAAASVANSIKSFLGFHSPTEQGPGSDADQWMPNMMNMFIDGIQSRIPQLQAVLGGALGNPFTNASAMIGYNMNQHMIAPAGGYSGSTVVNHITVQGSVIRESELTDMVARGVWDNAKLQSKI